MDSDTYLTDDDKDSPICFYFWAVELSKKCFWPFIRPKRNFQYVAVLRNYCGFFVMMIMLQVYFSAF